MARSFSDAWFKALVILFLGSAIGQPAAWAECGNARWWYPDDSDPYVQGLLLQSRMHFSNCLAQERPEGPCLDLLSLGERLVDYLLLQYQHARASSSRTHQHHSLLWLHFADRYAERTRSPTVRRFLLQNRASIEQPPKSLDPERWSRSVGNILRQHR